MKQNTIHNHDTHVFWGIATAYLVGMLMTVVLLTVPRFESNPDKFRPNTSGAAGVIKYMNSDKPDYCMGPDSSAYPECAVPSIDTFKQLE